MRMRSRLAPSAMRTPISRVRAVTSELSRPHKPIAVSSSAKPAKASARFAKNRGAATERSTTSRIVASPVTGISGSALATVRAAMRATSTLAAMRRVKVTGNHPLSIFMKLSPCCARGA